VYRGSDRGEKLILGAKLGVGTAQQGGSAVWLAGAKAAEFIVTFAVD
jgi:hypothetical protein